MYWKLGYCQSEWPKYYVIILNPSGLSLWASCGIQIDIQQIRATGEISSKGILDAGSQWSVTWRVIQISIHRFRTPIAISRPVKRLASIDCVLSTSSRFNPITVPPCTISGLKDVRTHLQTVYFLVLWHIYVQCHVFWSNSFHMPVQKRKEKGLRVSDFALSLVVFKWRHGSEGVTLSSRTLAAKQHQTRWKARKRTTTVVWNMKQKVTHCIGSSAILWVCRSNSQTK